MRFIPPSLSRRDFLLGTAAALVTSTQIAHARDYVPDTLQAMDGVAQIGPDGYPPTAIWGYGGTVPGPVIRVAQGSRIARRFLNALPQASTIHWHGIRIENAMDGVPELTQAPVEPGETFDYEFTVPDAGTYWYHPHNRTWEQMARGLYGALIVEESIPPTVGRDEVLLIDDWRLNQQAQIDESFGMMMDWSHAGRLGNWVTVNGKSGLKFPMGRNERIRLRLVNTANARIFSLAFNGVAGWVVALDGQPLPEIAPLESIVLAPAQRADIIVDAIGEPGSTASLGIAAQDGIHLLARFEIGDPIRGERLPTPDPLPANPVASVNALAEARPLVLKMEGGAMGGMRSAIRNGRSMPMRDLVSQGLVWAFNGVAGMPDEPLAEISRGEPVRLSIVNDTGWPHAMHLHGHHFRQVAREGRLGPLRDTILVDTNETVEIAFVADNPGDWLLHCHMLEHSAAGMMTWLAVA